MCPQPPPPPSRRIGKLIVSHGDLAKELLSAAQAIAGELSAFEALCLNWGDSVNEVRQKIQRRVEELDQGEGVLILTDMFGDTPSNACLPFLEEGKVEIVTGANLPMVVRLGCMSSEDMTLSELARWTQAKGRRAICVVSEMPQQREKAGEERPVKKPTYDRTGD